jgi:hypothetical protein
MPLDCGLQLGVIAELRLAIGLPVLVQENKDLLDERLFVGAWSAANWDFP